MPQPRRWPSSTRPGRLCLPARDAALALAEAGDADEARVKVAGNLERWPDAVRARILAGDALAVLGDTESALAHFQVALPLAEQAKDYKSIRELRPPGYSGLTRPAAGETGQRPCQPLVAAWRGPSARADDRGGYETVAGRSGGTQTIPSLKPGRADPERGVEAGRGSPASAGR